MEDPELEEALARLSDPFGFNLRTAIWLIAAGGVLLAIVILRMKGVLH